jgi:phosphoribosylformimino-5-aminoimidazole carboxamide ribotide isomerase
MQIIPVIDIAGGVAVHARAGDRARYQPVESRLAPGHPGDAVALVRAFRDLLDARTCYVADLDAIQGGPVQRGLLRELADLETGFGGALLVDAGTGTPGGALEVLSCGASEVVIGLETLGSFADLRRIVDALGPGRAVFSLDLRLGTPMLHPAMQDVAASVPDAAALALQAAETGVTTMLVLDVGRVGTGVGVDLGLLSRLRGLLPGLRLLAGGGVLTVRDLDRLRDAGCDGALVASALHAGRIGPEDVASYQSATSAWRYVADWP